MRIGRGHADDGNRPCSNNGSEQDVPLPQARGFREPVDGHENEAREKPQAVNHHGFRELGGSIHGADARGIPVHQRILRHDHGRAGTEQQEHHQCGVLCFLNGCFYLRGGGLLIVIWRHARYPFPGSVNRTSS